jgi:exodeoxyribonuclease VII small subunit
VGVEEQSFERVFGELDEAVRTLEQGGLPLDESIALFEQGMRLAQRCKALLDSAEARMTTLIEEFQAAGVASPEGSGGC